MFLSRAIQWLTSAAAPQVATESELKELIGAERLRSELSLRPFCFIYIESEQRFGDTESILKRIREREIRRTDTVGRFHDGVGILLPETDASGADTVLARLFGDLAVNARVHVFMGPPSEAFPAGRDADSELAALVEPVSAADELAQR